MSLRRLPNQESLAILARDPGQEFSRVHLQIGAQHHHRLDGDILSAALDAAVICPIYTYVLREALLREAPVLAPASDVVSDDRKRVSYHTPLCRGTSPSVHGLLGPRL